MQDLNKQQLILLALLVSFVTSIATGIVTVSLMDQAPAEMTQTINRVVEKTIERVVSEPSKQGASVAMRETIVVKADDLVIEAIKKNINSVVSIKEVTGDGEDRRESFAGLGLIISKEGLIVSDLSIAYRKTDESGVSMPESYLAVLPDGKRISLNIASSDQESGIILFQPFLQDRDKGTIRFSPPVFATSELELGQAVVALVGDEGSAVTTGIVSQIIKRKSSGSGATAEQTSAIKTDIRSPDLVLGSVLMNLSGEVIGINAGKSVGSSRNIFSPIWGVLDSVPKTLWQ